MAPEARREGWARRARKNPVELVSEHCMFQDGQRWEGKDGWVYRLKEGSSEDEVCRL